MVKFAVAPNMMIAQLWADWLTRHGVAATVQSPYANAAMGELPIDECAPTVWIDDVGQLAHAHHVLQALQPASNATGMPWMCHQCGEEVDAAFGQCWNCGCMNQQFT
jgi:rubrerythrin